MIVFAIYFGLFFLGYLVLLLLFSYRRPRTRTAYPGTTRVSILVAARNEEAQIIRCLEAICRLQYPPNQLEVLVGDDASTDNTGALIREFIRDKPHFRYMLIQSQLGHARGKANVLAQLTRAAATDIFLMTDADTAVPPDWVSRMLAGLKKDTGIVTGITTIAGSSLFARLQALDWINALGLMQVVSDLGLPVSTMGNNMLITRQAYEATGGFESLPFSLTEDVQLFQAVIRKGFKTTNIFDAGVLAFSTPAPALPVLWQQRKRWMGGVRFLPWYMILTVSAYGAFYGFCAALGLFFSWKAMLGIFLGKAGIQSVFIHRCLQRLRLRMPFKALFLFEVYLIFVSLITVSFYLLPVKTSWKGRKY